MDTPPNAKIESCIYSQKEAHEAQTKHAHKPNTAKLRLAKERYRFKEEMDRAIADLDNVNYPIPEESLNILQQVVNSTVKTCLGKHDRKH